MKSDVTICRSVTRLPRLLSWAAVLLCTPLSSLSHAAELTLRLTDQQGRALERAVATVSSPSLASFAPTEPVVHLMDQVDKRFSPDVMAIARNDYIRFPNSDDIRHHVYSFSVPKTFELPLYSGEPEEPVHFREAGLVVVGCNIHDRMQAHIYVIDQARFAVSSGGTVRFTDLPDEALTLTVLHPEAVLEAGVQLAIDSDPLPRELQLAVELKTPPEPDTSGMSELERKFHSLRHSQR